MPRAVAEANARRFIRAAYAAAPEPLPRPLRILTLSRQLPACPCAAAWSCASMGIVHRSQHCEAAAVVEIPPDQTCGEAEEDDVEDP